MISYLVFAGTIAGFYALLSLGLVTAWGQGGLVNLGLVGFVGLGAYTSALLSGAGFPIWLDWIAAAALSAAVGVALCVVVRNLRGDYLAIVTLGFAEILRLAETNEKWLTKGSDGISGIVAPLKSSLGNAFPLFYLVLTWALVGIATFLLNWLLRSPFGRALRAVRDDEQVAAVAGKSVLRLKLQAFGFGAALSGLAGALYAHFTSFIAPDVFTVQLTIYIFLAVTVGGYTRLTGAVVGSIALVALLEATRFIAAAIPALDAVQIASLREFAIAVTLILIMQLRPEGAFGMTNERSGPRQSRPAKDSSCAPKAILDDAN
jgi:branched-chain amino acid transport system permease protein